MHELMIDLETLGTGPTAVVISIGAAFFDIESGKIGEKFYQPVYILEQLKAAREINPDTLKWWMNQTDAAKKVFDEKAVRTQTACEEFCRFVRRNSPRDLVTPWGNGSTFDVTIMQTLLTQFGLEVPWQFYNVMDLRTYRRFVGKNAKVDRQGVHHNALDDVLSQINYVLKHSKNG